MTDKAATRLASEIETRGSESMRRMISAELMADFYAAQSARDDWYNKVRIVLQARMNQEEKVRIVRDRQVGCPLATETQAYGCTVKDLPLEGWCGYCLLTTVLEDV